MCPIARSSPRQVVPSRIQRTLGSRRKRLRICVYVEAWSPHGAPQSPPLSRGGAPPKIAIERLFYRGLFRGATGINHYESEMMVGNLVYNLVWLHVLKTGASVPVMPNFFNP